MTVVDTSTSSVSCPIVLWVWNWGDGSPNTVANTSASQSHVFTNAGPANKTFNITLTVTNSGALSNTSAAVVITVKKP
jgi:PKD repeat protein